RRDNCKFMRDTYFEILWMTLMREHIYVVLKYLMSQVEILLSGKVDVTDLLITQKVGAVYAKETYKIKILVDRMKALGKPIEIGERIDYLVVKIDEEKDRKVYLGDKLITYEMYQEEKDKYNIDYKYYLEKNMMSGID